MAAAAEFLGVTGGQFPCWEMRVVGDARRRTRREYVRSGGGEPIRVSRRAGQPGSEGILMDIGEAGARVRLGPCDFQQADPVVLTFRLGSERLLATGHVLDVRHLTTTPYADVVVTLEPTEAVRRMIVSHVLRRELEERRGAASGG
jgi:hypothetical protein